MPPGHGFQQMCLEHFNTHFQNSHKNAILGSKGMHEMVNKIPGKIPQESLLYFLLYFLLVPYLRNPYQRCYLVKDTGDLI